MVLSLHDQVIDGTSIHAHPDDLVTSVTEVTRGDFVRAGSPSTGRTGVTRLRSGGRLVGLRVGTVSIRAGRGRIGRGAARLDARDTGVRSLGAGQGRAIHKVRTGRGFSGARSGGVGS